MGNRILKILSVTIAILSLCAVSAGCGAVAEYSENTLVFRNDGSVIQYIIDENASAKMSEEEINEFRRTYVGEAVDAYNGAHEGGRIRIEESNFEEGSLRIVLSYSDAETYAEFNSVNCFTGTVAEAAEAGIDLNRTYRSVGGVAVSGQEVRTRLDECFMIIVNEPVRIELAKELIVLSEGAEISPDGHITINAPTDDTLPEEFRTTTMSPVYLIFNN